MLSIILTLPGKQKYDQSTQTSNEKICWKLIIKTLQKCVLAMSMSLLLTLTKYLAWFYCLLCNFEQVFVSQVTINTYKNIFYLDSLFNSDSLVGNRIGRTWWEKSTGFMHQIYYEKFRWKDRLAILLQYKIFKRSCYMLLSSSKKLVPFKGYGFFCKMTSTGPISL